MKGWRTIVFNICSLLAGAAAWADILPPKALPYIGVATAVGNVGLRIITDTPVGVSQ